MQHAQHLKNNTCCNKVHLFPKQWPRYWSYGDSCKNMQWYPMAGRYLLLSSKEFWNTSKHAAWGWLVGGISRNHPKPNFSIFLNMLVCRINSVMNVFLKYAILYNGWQCRGWLHLHPIFPASWLHHRQMGTASLLKSLGMRGLMKVTGFRYLTERDATLGWLWCRSDGIGYHVDDFLYEDFLIMY